MQKLFTLLVCLFVFLGVSGCNNAGENNAAPAENALVYSTGFEGDNPFEGWQNVGSFASQVDGRNGGKCLQVDFSSQPKGEGGMVYFPVDVNKVRGCKIVVTCYVKAENVAKQEKRNMDVKVMLHTKSTTGPNWRENGGVFGTFDWRRMALTADIPENVTDLWFYLGLQGTTGKVWFDDVEVRIIRPLVAVNYKVPSGPAYKGHNLPRLRGAMAPSDPTVEDTKALAADWGANVMRYQMGIGRFKREKKIPRDDPVNMADYDEWLEKELADLDNIIPTCRENGMLLVVDLHSCPGSWKVLFEEKKYQDKLVSVWEMIARRYKGETVIWGYDFYNEPRDAHWDPSKEGGVLDWQGLVQRVATAVRKIDSEATFIVESADWANPAGFSTFLPINDPKTVYSVHMYYPHTFTHQGVKGKSVGIPYPGKIKDKFWDKAALENSLQPVIDFQKKYNVHIYVGEFSAIRWAPDNSAFRYMRDVIDIFEKHGWDWTYHAFREWSGWSLEHTTDPKNTKKAETRTDREQLFRDWFAKNKKPKF